MQAFSTVVAELGRSVGCRLGVTIKAEFGERQGVDNGSGFQT
jgi:hypothetical protein